MTVPNRRNHARPQPPQPWPPCAPNRRRSPWLSSWTTSCPPWWVWGARPRRHLGRRAAGPTRRISGLGALAGGSAAVRQQALQSPNPTADDSSRQDGEIRRQFQRSLQKQGMAFKLGTKVRGRAFVGGAARMWKPPRALQFGGPPSNESAPHSPPAPRLGPNHTAKRVIKTRGQNMRSNRAVKHARSYAGQLGAPRGGQGPAGG